VESKLGQLDRIKVNASVGTQEFKWATIESVDGLREGDFLWLIEQAERKRSLEIERQDKRLASKVKSTLSKETEEKNTQLEDKLNYVKKLVESNRTGHAIKFDLKMSLRGMQNDN